MSINITKVSIFLSFVSLKISRVDLKYVCIIEFFSETFPSFELGPISYIIYTKQIYLLLLAHLLLHPHSPI